MAIKSTASALDNDAVQIVVRGTAYMGWQDLDIDSDILNQADAFKVSGTIPKPSPTANEVRAGAPAGAFEDFREGQKCDVLIGNDRQMAGVIDDVDFSGDRQLAKLKISGRDLGGFLVDSEAKHIKTTKYTIKTMIEALLDRSWGIRNVIVSNEDNRKILLGKKDKKKPTAATPTFLKPIARERTKIDPGQRIAAILDIHTKRLGITWWLTAHGDLFIGKPNYSQDAAYHFYAYARGKKGKDTNVESWTVTRSTSDRFSEIKVVGQGIGEPAKLFVAATSKPKYVATVQDPDLVERGIVRKQIISDSDILSSTEAKNRADHEMGMRRLKGLTITLTVPGFRQGDRLYAVDTLATVKIEEADIDGTYYVTQRRFTETRGKRRTQLTLHPSKVWLA